MAIIFYLKALAQVILAENKERINETISEGIFLITKNRSVNMLANLYYLSSIINDEGRRNEDMRRSEIFKDLYGEVVNTKISEY
jgi:hypothetical protein